MLRCRRGRGCPVKFLIRPWLGSQLGFGALRRGDLWVGGFPGRAALSASSPRQVLAELKEYATEVDVDFVRKAVRAIGRCAIKVEVRPVRKGTRAPRHAVLCVTLCPAASCGRASILLQPVLGELKALHPKEDPRGALVGLGGGSEQFRGAQGVRLIPSLPAAGLGFGAQEGERAPVCVPLLLRVGFWGQGGV